MAKLVTKFKFLKPNARTGAGGYARYIGTREGAEKIDDSQKYAPATAKQKQIIRKILKDFPDSKKLLEYEDYKFNSNTGNASDFISRAVEENSDELLNSKTYADYIATRPRAQKFGSHGLFTDDGVQVQLSKVSEELNLYKGNIWTIIVSLRREDAERLGFNTGERWREMLRGQTQELSEQFHIPLQDLKWFAAFHNESHHPHVHIMVYSQNETQGYLTKKGVEKLRSALAKEIFAQDLMAIYEKQTDERNELRHESDILLKETVEKIKTGTNENPRLEAKLWELALKLSQTSGKKVYGYLKADVKNMVDALVDMIASDERIATLYRLWYEQREEIIHVYTEETPERLPLSQNQEFKPVKNMVIREAMKLLEIASDRVNTEEESAPSSIPEPNHMEIRDQNDNTTPIIPSPDSEPVYTNKVYHSNFFGSTAALLSEISRIIQDRIEEDRKHRPLRTERKLKQKTNEKKQAQGLKMG